MDEILRNWSECVCQSLLKENSPKSAVRVMFGVLSTPAPNDGLEDFDEENSVKKQTLRTLEEMAEKLPPEEFLRDMLEVIKPAIKSMDPHFRKAAFLMLGTLASEPRNPKINKYWKRCLQYILKGIVDPHPVVQNAAYFAFSKYMPFLFQVDDNAYAEKIVPVLQSCVSNLVDTWEEQGDNIQVLPHMPDFLGGFRLLFLFDLSRKQDEPPSLCLLRILLQTINSAYPVNIQESAFMVVEYAMEISNILGVTRFFPYFYHQVHKFVGSDLGPKTASLQISVLAALRSVISEISYSLTEKDDKIDLGAKMRSRLRSLGMDALVLIRNTFNKASNRADLDKIVYAMTGLYDILQTEVEDLLDHIVSSNIQTLKETAEAGEVSAALSNQNQPKYAYPRFINKFEFSSTTAGRKERACAMFNEFAKVYRHTPAFDRYIDRVFDQLKETTNDEDGRVRSEALEAMASLCTLVETDDSRLQNMVDYVIQKCVDFILNDTSKDAVLGALSSVRVLLLRNVGTTANRANTDAIVLSLGQFFTYQTKYQLTLKNYPSIIHNVGEYGDFESIMFDYCAEVLESLGEDLPTEEFATIFVKLCPLVLSQMDSLCRRPRAIKYSLTCCIQVLSKNCEVFADKIVATLIRYSSVNTTDTTRITAVDALTSYVAYGKRSLCPYYPEILSAFQNALSDETPRKVYDDVHDTICAGIATMITTDASLIPLDDILPIFFKHLSLNAVTRETESLTDCFNILYKLGHPMVKERIALITEIAAHVGSRSYFRTTSSATKLLLIIKQDFPEVFQDEMNKLSDDALKTLERKFIKTT